MNAFLIDRHLLTERNKICEMWADHFEFLGKPSDSSNFDDAFCHHVSTRTQNIFKTYTNDLLGALCKPVKYMMKLLRSVHN